MFALRAFLPFRSCFFVVVMALFGPSHAADSANATPSPSQAASGDEAGSGIGILSGGIGQEGQEEMRRVAQSFNVHVLFATQRGEYLADIPFTVTDQRGRQVAAAVSQGPWLYLKLPPGTYQVTAQRHGASQTQHVKLAPNVPPVALNFLFPDQ